MATSVPVNEITRFRGKLARGFTIIELIMVMLIVGILAALTVPRFESFYVAKLDGAIKKVVSDIRYTQYLASSRHEDYRINFNAANNSYQVQRVADGSLVIDPFTRGNLTVNFNSDYQYRGIDIQNPDFGGSPTLQFDWEGTPVAAGSVDFVYKSRTRTISITPNTGMVNVL